MCNDEIARAKMATAQLKNSISEFENTFNYLDKLKPMLFNVWCMHAKHFDEKKTEGDPLNDCLRAIRDALRLL